MIVSVAYKPSSPSSGSGGVLLQLLTAWSLLSKARFLGPYVFPGEPSDQTLLAIIEWSDVAVIIVWTVVFVSRYAPAVRGGICLLDDVPTEHGSPTLNAAFLRSGDSRAKRPGKSNDSATMGQGRGVACHKGGTGDGAVRIAFFSLRFLASIATLWFFAGIFVSLASHCPSCRSP